MKNSGFKKFFMKDGVLLALAIIASVESMVFYSLRTCFVFTDIQTFNGMASILVWLSIVNAVITVLLFILKTNQVKLKDREICKTKLFAVFYVLSVLVAIFFLIFIVSNFIISGAETSPVNLRYLQESLPLDLTLLTILLLALLLPKVKSQKAKTATAIAGLAAVFIITVLSLYPCYPYKITSDPMVVDNGKDFVVVFATNDKGTGYVKYNYNGEDYKVFDQHNGRIKGKSKIHSIEIPKEHLAGNSYSVGSRRVIDERSYGGRQGKEVVSGTYEFDIPKGSDQTYLTVSDWHSYLKLAYEAIGYAGDDYDGVILLGDCAPGLMFEDEVKTYLVEFGGKISGGKMPVIYIRGNHETRGKVAGELAEYLKFDEFYYTTTYGDYDFLILDSGEDKPDDHPEYGGMVDYEQERSNMVQWMTTLPKTDNKLFTLVHYYKICIEDELKAKAYEELHRLGCKQIISGHTHRVDFLEEDGFNVFMDGGIHGGKTFIASKFTLNSDGYRFECFESTGEKVADESYSW